MLLEEYLKRPGALSREEICTGLGISQGRLSQLKNDGRDWPAELALEFEKLTGGEVNASDLSGIVAKARAA